MTLASDILGQLAHRLAQMALRWAAVAVLDDDLWCVEGERRSGGGPAWQRDLADAMWCRGDVRGADPGGYGSGS